MDTCITIKVMRDGEPQKWKQDRNNVSKRYLVHSSCVYFNYLIYIALYKDVELFVP